MDTAADADVCAVCGYEFPVPRRGVRASAWLMAALMVGLVPLLAWLFGFFG